MSIFDGPTFPFDTEPGRDLAQLLSDIYWRQDDTVSILRQAGVPLRSVRIDAPPEHLWQEILDLSARRARLKALLNAILEDEKNAAYSTRIRELLSNEPVVTFKRDIGSGWTKDRQAFHAERQTGPEPTLLHIAFLQGGVDVAPAVCRLRVSLPSGRYTATGFLIANNTILTNHHVLYECDPTGQTWHVARQVEAWFGYETKMDGSLNNYLKLDLSLARIVGDPEADWAAIVTTTQIPRIYASLPLGINIQPRAGQGVCIVQHPNGKPKQVGLKHNSIVSIEPRSMYYLTDTEPGSSGSPIFTENWQVVGLHRGSRLMDIDGRSCIVNEGLPIRAAADGLMAHRIAFTADVRQREIP